MWALQSGATVIEDMWTTERKQVVQDLGDQSDDESFEVYVERKRREAEETRNISVLVAKLQELERQHAALTRRYQMRQRRRVETEMDQVRALIQRRESGEEQSALERVLHQYVEAYKAAHNDSTTSTSSRSRKRLVSGMFKNKTAAKAAAAAAKGPKLRAAYEGAEGSEKRYYMQDSVKHELMAETGSKAPPIYLVQGDMCAKCNVPMIVLASEALLGCPKCSRTRLYIQATSSRIAYGEEVEFANFSYKRQNHFIEWLNTFQAKESTEVPQPIIDQVMEELYSKKMLDINKITQKKVREVMKELKLRKYYDHCAQITKRITGKLPPRMTPFQAEQVKLMFSAIQGPFNMHCPPERTNFLSYGYCLYKFCELLGYDEFLPCFPLLKGKDKLAAMDRIWKKICMELDWQFIPTVAEDALGFKLIY